MPTTGRRWDKVNQKIFTSDNNELKRAKQRQHEKVINKEECAQKKSTQKKSTSRKSTHRKSTPKAREPSILDVWRWWGVVDLETSL